MTSYNYPYLFQNMYTRVFISKLKTKKKNKNFSKIFIYSYNWNFIRNIFNYLFNKNNKNMYILKEKCLIERNIIIFDILFLLIKIMYFNNLNVVLIIN